MPQENYIEIGHMHIPVHYSNQELAEGFRKRTKAVVTIHASALIKVKAIESSSELTITGEKTAKKELESVVKLEREGWLGKQSDIDDQIRQIEEKMTLNPPRPDDVVAAIREWELRGLMRKMDPVDLQTAYKAAAESGDDLFVDAVEKSPIPFVFDKKEDVVEQVRFARLKNKYPKDAVQLSDLKLGKTNTLSALKSVEINLARHGLNIADDPLADA